MGKLKALSFIALDPDATYGEYMKPITSPPTGDLKQLWNQSVAEEVFGKAIHVHKASLTSPKKLEEALTHLAEKIVKAAHVLGYTPFCVNDPKYGKMMKLVLDMTVGHDYVTIAGQIKMVFEGNPQQFVEYMALKLDAAIKMLAYEKQRYERLCKEVQTKMNNPPFLSPIEEIKQKAGETVKTISNLSSQYSCQSMMAAEKMKMVKHELFYGKNATKIKWKPILSPDEDKRF